MQSSEVQVGQSRVPRYLRAPEAASVVGLAKSTLAKLRCSGLGPTYTKLGRAVVYARQDLDAWVADQGKRRSSAG